MKNISQKSSKTTPESGPFPITDARGHNKLWMYCYVCNENADYFEQPGNVHGDEYGIFDYYETGKEYQYILVRSNGKVKWIVKDGSGNTLKQFSKQMNDFSRIEVESWEEWSGGETNDPTVIIKDINLAY